MKLKKLGVMTAAVLVTGLALSGCSLKEKLRDMTNSSESYPVETAPSLAPEESSAVGTTPEPTQSSSNEVKDLEVDLKAVKFDQESFE